MIEMILSAADPIVRKLHSSKLPDCAAILEGAQSGKKAKLHNPFGYVLLCRITTIGLIIRGLGQAWLILAAVILIRHFPFSAFDENQHKLFLKAALFPAVFPDFPATLQPIPLCEWMTFVSVAAVVACAISLDIIARLAQFLAAECCKIPEPIRRSGTAA